MGVGKYILQGKFVLFVPPAEAGSYIFLSLLWHE